MIVKSERLLKRKNKMTTVKFFLLMSMVILIDEGESTFSMPSIASLLSAII